MLNFKENIDVLDKIIINYLTVTDIEYKLFDENNQVVDRTKLIKLINPTFFNNELIVEIFKTVKSFFFEYNKIPGRTELFKFMAIKNMDITKEQFDVIFDVDLSQHTSEFIFQYVKTFILLNSITYTLTDIGVYMKTQDITPKNINNVYDYIRNKININMDIDLTNENMGLDIKNPDSHIQPVRNKKSTGYKYFDKVLEGGWEKRTLIVIQGRPKVGKSLILCNLAARSAQMGSNVGIFTVELGDRKYMKRIGSNMYSIPFKEYSKFVDEDTVSELKPIIDQYYIDHPETGELWIKEYPTGGASVIDIENYFLKMENHLGKKFDVIFVDYINLLKPSKDDSTMYERIKKITEELRRIAQRNDWCIISATQVKSSYFTSNELYLDSTAESSGLVATVDSLFGATGDPGDPSLKIKNLANRDSGNMESYAHFIKDTTYFRLVEDTTPGSDHYTDDNAGDIIEKHYSEVGLIENSLIGSNSGTQIQFMETPSRDVPVNMWPEVPQQVIPVLVEAPKYMIPTVEGTSDPNALLLKVGQELTYVDTQTPSMLDFQDILNQA